MTALLDAHELLDAAVRAGAKLRLTVDPDAPRPFVYAGPATNIEGRRIQHRGLPPDLLDQVDQLRAEITYLLGRPAVNGCWWAPCPRCGEPVLRPWPQPNDICRITRRCGDEPDLDQGAA